MAFFGISNDKVRLCNLLRREDLFGLMISIDFTKTNISIGYEATNRYKKVIFDLFSKSAVYHIDLGSKFFLIFRKKEMLNESKIKKEIDLKTKLFVSEEIKHSKMGEIFERNLKNLDSDSLVYFSSITISQFTLEEIESYFVNFANLEQRLIKNRIDIQKKFESGNIEDEQDFNFKFFPKKVPKSEALNLIQNNFRKIGFSFSKSLKNAHKRLIHLMEHKDKIKASVKNKIRKEIYCDLVDYYLWVLTGDLLSDIYSKEKILKFFDRKKKLFVLRNTRDWLVWYDSVISSYYPFFDHKLKKIAKELKDLIIDRKFKGKNLPSDVIAFMDKGSPLSFSSASIYFAYYNEVIRLIDYFVESFKDINVHTIPFKRIEFSKKSQAFMEKVFYNRFGADYLRRKSEFLKSNFTKKKIPYSSSGTLSNFLDAIKFLFGDRIDYFSIGFMELDGFNAFNKYIFGSENDFFYSKIVNLIYEVADDFSNKDKNFLNMVTYILGDEFFIFFEGKINRSLLENYFQTLKVRIERLFSDLKFIPSTKMDVKVEGSNIKFRKSYLSGYDNFSELTLAKLGVSKVCLFNISSKDKFESAFVNYMTRLNKMMDKEKKNKAF